jgi:PadR family transcriptional regulator PadR
MVAPTADAGSQLRKGVVEFAVLALLRSEPMYGWQLSQMLVARGNFIASIGTLYPVMSRLRAKSWVTTYDESSESGPARRYYRLTAAGEQALAQFRQQWATFSVSVNELMQEEGN